jgi:DNA-binding FadR family transcriptional regulator
MKYWIHLKLMIGRIPAQALERHREIYQAISSRNAEASRALMQEHLNETTHAHHAAHGFHDTVTPVQ